MSTITLQDFQRDPNLVLNRIEAGESMYLTDGEKTVAEVRPVEPKRTMPRPFGLAKGAFVVPSNFDAPLPDDILDAFEGR